MDSAVYCIALLVILSLVQKVQTANPREFFFDVINGNSEEYNTVKFALNNTSDFKNITLTLKTFSTSENVSLFNQAFAFLEQDIVALIEGSHTKMAACALSTVTGIPLVRLRGNKSPFDQCGKAVYMSAGYRDYAHATFDMIKKFQWRKIALVFDENRVYEAGYFHAISRNSKLTVNLVHLYEKGRGECQTGQKSRAIEQIENFKADVVLLYTCFENIELILQQKPCSSTKDIKWIIQEQVLEKLRCHPDRFVLTLNLPYTWNGVPEKLKKVVLRFDNNTRKGTIALAYDAVQIIAQALSKDPYTPMNGSAIGSRDRDLFFSTLKKANLDGITGPVQFNDDGERNVIQMGIFNLRNNSFRKIGIWNSSKHVKFFGNIKRNREDPFTGGSLEGKKLRVVVVEDEPFVMTEKQKDGTNSYNGYCIDLLNELAKMLHFTFEIYPTPDGLYGSETENGTWNGMIGELVNERANMALAALTITEEREKVVDFSVPFMYYTDDMLLKKTSSKEGTLTQMQFMNPFHSDVWLSTLVTLVIISVAVFVINYFSPYGYKDETGQGTSDEFSYFNSLWFALGCMLQQGSENQPRSLSGRILASCYWFCILIWVSTYTANLAAFLTVKNAHSPINNLEDIVKTSYQVGVIKSGIINEFFQRSKYEKHKQIWQRIKGANSFFNSTAQAVEWLRQREEAVFIYDGPIISHIANRPPCNLITVPGINAERGLALAFPINDPYIESFSLAILQLHENGFFHGLKREWWESSQICPEEQETTLSQKRIDLKTMLGVYIVLASGIVVAFLTLAAEIVWKRRKERKLMTYISRLYKA